MSKSSPAARKLFHLLALDYNHHHDTSNGRFTSSGSSGKIKYAKSPRANSCGLTVSPKTFGIIRGKFNTLYANAPKGARGEVSYKKKRYRLEADGSGSVIVLSVKKEL